MSLFTAAPSSLLVCRPGDTTRAPLLPKVRGQFAEFLNRGSLVHLGGHPPAYRCRFAVRAEVLSLAAFLGGLGLGHFPPVSRSRVHAHASASGSSLTRALAVPNPPCPFGGLPFPTASPLHSHKFLRCRTLSPACHRLRLQRPRLRTRLTLGRLTVPRNPQAFGGGGSHTTFRYSFRHSHFCSLHRSSRSGFSAPERSPTRRAFAPPRLRWDA